MKIKSAEFMISAPRFNLLPKADKEEIVLIGKSNVGKSSFINAFTSTKGLARTSSSPGKTTMANYYLINDLFYLVDMPGYGYAKVGKSQKLSFSKIITDYLKKRDADFLVFFLLDCRHKPTNNDIIMYEQIISYDINPIIILTKWDKLSNNERTNNLKIIKNTLNLSEDDLILPCSAKTKNGFEEIKNIIEEILYKE